MNESAAFSEKPKAFWEKVGPVFQKIGHVISLICAWIFRLRKIIMAVPVIYYAIKLAVQNMQRLPETVGLDLLSSGEFAHTVTRNYAVYGPLGVTAFCLFLMFCSRKTLFPWLVSIFSLAIPVLIWLTNTYPA